ncbi:hypothetical protein [Brachyspira murdochii]|uniref:Uncharacterized protein n=1 Tax=Brachyspira murdochii TaxID=84378 RepID=A0ABX5B362_9SPIR|nr:hypothetical protein [Brachyspira murdochii]PPS21703.1 hypothetical protein DJ52_09260 [Brachyspira murdochii]
MNKNIYDTNKELQNIEESIKKINSAYEKSSFFSSKDSFDEFSSSAAEAKTSIDNIETSINSLDNSINKADIKSFSSEIKDSLSSISSIYKDLSASFSDFFHYDLSSYDNAIEEAKNKLQEFDDYQKELRENKKTQDAEDYENYLSRLDEELELAIENKDAMSSEAIRIKQEELKKKQEKEKEDLQKEKEIEVQRELLEKQLAQAEYNKAYAEWDNEVKLAEMEKSKAIADAVLIPSLAIAQSALGVASSFAQGGPVGFAAGLVISATAISSAISAASGIVSSANALDSVKSNPPKAPQFAFGTTGYIIPDGGSAIVGEMGAEIVTNKAGKIQVQSNAQLQERGFSKGDIWNVTINVEQALNPDEVYKLMNSYKARNSQMYAR